VTRLEKRIRRLRESPKDVSSRELIGLLLALGFEEKVGKGSHTALRHPVSSHIITVPHQSPLLAAYVKQALKMIDELLDEDPHGRKET
jgi:predicted RNA binding protein YcfA (HicA-like mRNA interferase family)